MVFHCTAGKDRTGFAAALILLTLGVPRDVAMHDEFLNAALHMVDNDFGGVQAYLVDVLGVDAVAQKELAGRYLQAV
jgi:protein-tyrosine phosphatase